VVKEEDEVWQHLWQTKAEPKNSARELDKRRCKKEGAVGKTAL